MRKPIVIYYGDEQYFPIEGGKELYDRTFAIIQELRDAEERKKLRIAREIARLELQRKNLEDIPSLLDEYHANIWRYCNSKILKGKRGDTRINISFYESIINTIKGGKDLRCQACGGEIEIHQLIQRFRQERCCGSMMGPYHKECRGDCLKRITSKKKR